MKQITHSLFPRWHEDWQEEGRTYLIMEYISGTTIEELLKRRGSIFLWDALSITVDLAAGLLHLHENRPPILYRDLKPSNVMIQDTGTVRLIDLGTADERPTVMAGTPGYTATEILDDPVSLHTPTCDVYSVGILLHTMLTGHDPTRPPYRLEPLAAYGLRRLESIDQIILDCTCTDPQDRIPGMRELLRRINAFRPGFRFTLSRTKDTLQYQKNIWLTTYQKV
jgi:serine/threonine-protein kinase